MNTQKNEKTFLGKIMTFDFGDSNLVSAIKKDHDDLRRFIDILKSDEHTLSQKKRAYELFTTLLKSHSKAEEQAVYALTEDIKDLRVDTLEGEVEHKVADALMEKISHTRQDEKWEAEVKVLAELVEHHIKEEESDYLPELEKKLDEDKQDAMALKFMALRQETQKQVSSENAGILGQLQ